MTYKSKDKSFFDEIYKKEIKEPLEERKEDLHELEKKGKRKFLKFYDFGTSKLRDEIKRKPAQYFFLFLTSFLGSVITSSVALFIFTGNVVTQFVPKANQEVMSAQTQNSAKVIRVQKYDPLLLASKLRKGEKDFTLIDIRSREDYIKGHIITAVNLPIFGTELVDKNGNLNEGEVKKLMAQYLDGDRLVVIYGQNSYSTIPSDIAALLVERFPNVKALAVGWEEWAYLNK